MRKYIFAHPWVLALSALTGGVLQGLIILTNLITRDIVDAMVAADRAAFFSHIGMAAIIVVLVYLFTLISTRMFFAYMFKSKRTLERDFFGSIMAMKISDFNRDNSSRYISVLNNDIKSIAERYFQPMAQFSKDALSVILAIAALIMISPVNALIAVLTAFLPLIAPIVYGKRLAATQLAVSTNVSAFNQKVKDYLTGFEVIKTGSAEKKIIPRFYEAATRWMRSLYRSGAAVSDVGALTMAIVMATLFLNYFVAGWFVFTGSVTVGGVVAIVALSGSIMQPMTLVANHISSIRSAKEISQRVLDMMNQEDKTARPLQLGELDEGIVLENVSFTYDSEADAPPAVSNFSYTFKRGGKYAVVGASGSGKSTLARLILGYYDNYEGSVKIGGHEIRDIARESLYGSVAALPQNVFMLDDTLRNNITLYSPCDEARYNAVLEQANLAAVAETLANGSDTALGEGGNTLSGGERQRVSIARALLRGNEVLVMDEATSSLDSKTAHEIESAIMGMEGLTCIFVTHRNDAEILERCDGVITFPEAR